MSRIGSFVDSTFFERMSGYDKFFGEESIVEKIQAI